MTDKHDRDLKEARLETRAAFENRAMIYAYMLEELESEIGLEKAVDVMKRAIYRRGTDVGRKYKKAAESCDLSEVGKLFVEGSPSGGALFEPAVDREADEQSIIMRMTACPLVDAWQAAGYDEKRVDLLCEIAAAVDYGTFEGAGLHLEFLDRKGCCGSDRCLLRISVP